MAGKGQAGQREALGQVPRRVGAHKGEGNAFGIGLSQRHHAVTDLLDRGRIHAAKNVDVVAHTLGVVEKAIIGKEQGAGAVGVQRFLGVVPRAVAGQGGGRLNFRGDGLVTGQARQQAGQGKAARRRGGRVEDFQMPLVRVVKRVIAVAVGFAGRG